MTDLFLSFLAVYYLNGLVLAVLPDARSHFDHPAPGPWLAAGAVLLLSTAQFVLALPWPPRAIAYLHMLGFFMTLAAIGTLPGSGRGMRRWRVLLPQLSASLAVLAVVAMAAADRRDWPQALLLMVCMGAAAIAARSILAALDERIAMAALPPALRGTPISLLSCAGMALATMGFAGALPW